MFRILTKRILTCLCKKKGLFSILVQNSPKVTKKVLVFRKVARSCSLTKKLLKILKVPKKLPSRICKGLLLNADNGHFFLAQSTDSHRKSTSLMQTLDYQLCAVIDLSFLKVKRPSVDSTVDVTSATVHRTQKHRIQRIALALPLFIYRVT